VGRVRGDARPHGNCDSTSMTRVTSDGVSFQTETKLDASAPPALQLLLAEDADAIPQRIFQLECELTQLRRQVRDQTDARWLRVVFVASRGRPFSVGDLRRRCVLEADLRAVLAARSNQQIGKQLQRLRGHDVAGFRTTYVTRENGRGLWQIDFTEPSGLDDGARP
jgi:hypothetical protein